MKNFEEGEKKKKLGGNGKEEKGEKKGRRAFKNPLLYATAWSMRGEFRSGGGGADLEKRGKETAWDA